MIAERLDESEGSDSGEYDAFEALCDAIFPNDEDGLMFFWKAHFDASGNHSPLLVVAGYLSERPQWKAFNKAWKAPLTKDGKVDIFHATDFEAGEGAFTVEKGWTPERRAAARIALVNAIDDSGLKVGVACSVVVKDYDEVEGGWRRELSGDAYEFCVSNCSRALGIFSQQIQQRDPIAFIVEAGEKGEVKIQEAFLRLFADDRLRKGLRLGSITFLPKDQAVGLQAADMLANYYWRHRNGALPDAEPYSRIIKSPSRPLLLMDYDKARLEQMHGIQDQGYKVTYPEMAIEFKTPEKVAVNVEADFSEIENVLADLESLAETHLDLVYPLIKDAASVSKLFRVETQDAFTAGANTLRVSLKPQQFAFDSVAALRTSHGDRKLGE